MATVRELIIAKSTAGSPNTVRAHLLSTSPGGGGFGTIYGETVVELAADMQTVMEPVMDVSIEVSDLQVVIDADLIVECE